MTEKESDVRNTIIMLGGWPKKKVMSGILSSFLAGNPKRKWGQESYHHSWRVTQKVSDVRNPIIIIGRWPNNIKVRSGILSSFLAGDPKSKWGQESYHHSWRVIENENEVRNSIIILSGWPKKKVRKRKLGQEFYHHSWRVAEKESEVWNSIIILGGWPKKKMRSIILSSFLAGDRKRKWGQVGILSSFLAGDRKSKWGQESYHYCWRVTFSLLSS
jgi:hypothetical protein